MLMTGDPAAIVLHFGEVEQVVAHIKRFESTMDASLNELYRQFTTLFAADWQGQAGQACDEARRQWNQGASEIKAALGQLGGKLGQTAGDFQSLDASIAAGIV